MRGRGSHIQREGGRERERERESEQERARENEVKQCERAGQKDIEGSAQHGGSTTLQDRF